ncbi:hypothetical protein HAX54_002687 [Datura stramonium]|uniref:Uncharacterized protein n=1 Tax=Datura stramonium TaxID=4076 RepID=A0ABS8RT30_DATST|nr:hypothetical protein [Datura stramonium]
MLLSISEKSSTKIIGVSKVFSVPRFRRDSVLLVHAVGDARKCCGSSLMFYWSLISGSRDLLLLNPGVYEQLVIYETSASELDIIEIFLAPFLHIFSLQRHGPGQGSPAILYMSEEDAFWLLVALLKGAVHTPMEGMYLVGLPLVQQYLFQFDRLNLGCLSFEGVKVVFKVGLALLKYCHDDLVKLPFEKLIHALRSP